MDAETLLLSTKSLLQLQEAQAKAEGREFSARDAIAAVRPALESVLSELLDLQRGPNKDAKCPHCSHNLVVSVEDIYSDYDTADPQDIIDYLDELTGPEIQVLHDHEKRTQKRGQVLSAMAANYAIVSSGGHLSDPQDGNEETERKLDKMFDDLFPS